MSGIHHRRNINCLSSAQLHDLREAIAAMYQLPASNPNSFARQASFHGGPPVAYCRHGAPGFLTWHRAELKAFEDALRAVGCHVALPFWDWSSAPTTGIPAACRHPTYVNRSGNTVANPLYSGPRPAGGMTVRSSNVDSASFADLVTSVQSAMSETSFVSLQNLLNGPHGSVHVRVGGDMGSVPTASYDPIFYFHHANVDRIWARWQLDHPGALPAAEAGFELPPFTRPFSTEWQRGSDVLSTESLGYRYRTWCLLLPTIHIWDVVQLPRELPFPQIAAARLVVRSHSMQEQPLEIRVFVDQPDATGRTPTADNPSFLGAVGFIGMGAATHRVPRPCPVCGHPDHDHGAEKTTAGHDEGGDDHAQAHRHGHHTHHHHAPATGVEERFDVELPLAGALLDRLTSGKEPTLRLVAVDAEGRDVPADRVNIDAIELSVEA
jgi:tyrosinase